MPFEKGSIPQGATPFEKGVSGNPEGRPVGSRNRSTIAKRILEMNCVLPEEVFEKVKAIYPEIEQRMSAEEMATIVQITNAISKGDTNAYKAIMDSAYGAPKQELEGNFENNTPIQVNIVRPKEVDE